MCKYLILVFVILVASPALAGGIERNAQSMDILFQKGSYIELGVIHGWPRVSGTNTAFPPLGQTGNVARRFFGGSLSFKGDINDQLSYAMILDQPYGAYTLYPSGTGLAGSLGKIENTTLTGVLRYQLGNGLSAHGGLRSSWTNGAVELPGFGYGLSTNTDQAFGYLLGVAYEKPEIALRVTLTYNSKIQHSFKAVEAVGLFGPVNTTFSSNLPQSVNLEFQSGVAEDTLLFGSVRWVDWKDFSIEPTVYQSDPANPPLVAYQKNSTTYRLGVGRRFTENWSGSVSVSHDTGNGSITGNLGPIGKRSSVALSASHTVDAMTISGGVEYSRIGSVITEIGNPFDNNSAIGAGLRIGYSF